MPQHLVITRSGGPLEEDLWIRFKGNTMIEISTTVLFARLWNKNRNLKNNL